MNDQQLNQKLSQAENRTIDEPALHQFLLASILATYPDSQFCDYIEKLLQESRLTLPEALKNLIVDTIQDAARLDDVSSEFIDVFERGRGANPLYETEYGRDRAMVKGSELADIAGFYRAFGFDFGGDDLQKEMLDHVAVELEFYALLLIKQSTLSSRKDEEGVAVVHDARKKFLQDHLGRFVGAIADRPGVKNSNFYAQVFGWCRDIIDQECQRLNVGVVPAEWIAMQVEQPEQVECETHQPTQGLYQLTPNR